MRSMEVSEGDRWRCQNTGTDGCVRTVKLLISDSTLYRRGKRVTNLTYLERPIQTIVTLIEAN